MTCALPPSFGGSTNSWTTKLSVNASSTSLSIAWDPGPTVGPAPIAAGSQTASADLVVGGQAVTAKAPTLAVAQPPRTPGPSQTATATISAKPTAVEVKKITFDDTSFSNVDVTCTPNSAVNIALKSVSLPATPPTSDGPIAVTGTLGAGASVTLAGDGFKASSDVTAIVYSTPVPLGTAAATATGTVSIAVKLPSALEAGTHTVVLLGVNDAGAQRALTQTFTVTATSASTPPPASGGTGGTGATSSSGGVLAATGLQTWQLVLIALVALQIGAVVLVRSQRAMALKGPAGRHVM